MAGSIRAYAPGRPLDKDGCPDQGFTGPVHDPSGDIDLLPCILLPRGFRSSLRDDQNLSVYGKLHILAGENLRRYSA